MRGDLVRWLLWSPTRLLLAAVAVVSVVLGITVVLGAGSITRAGDLGPATRPRHPTAVAPVPASPSVRPATDAGGANRREVLPIVTAFVTAWSNVDGHEPEEWLRRVSRHATPDLAAALRSTDPARLPMARVDGAPRLRSAGPYAALADVRLADGDTVTVTVAFDGGEWRVTAIEPASG